MNDYKNILNYFNRINNKKYYIYHNSVCFNNDNLFFMVKDKSEKYLVILEKNKMAKGFEYSYINNISINGKFSTLKTLKLTDNNLRILCKIFPHIKPSLCNKSKSFSTGDRLGNATPAHVEAIKDKDIFPIFAQQSVRELNKTRRTWLDVINNAIWGYFESGSKIPFGADADHIKEKSDLKEAADAGFTMFTVDPSDYIKNIFNIEKTEIEKSYYSIKKLDYLKKKYLNKNLTLGGKKYFIDQDILIPMSVKYYEALNRVSSLYDFLKNYKREEFDFEVSMDEIQQPITPLEHYFISEELFSSEVIFQNLALSFTGRWEKAIDFAGDIKIFKEDLIQHRDVVKKFNNYKLSLHSGSEKFSIYPLFSSINEGSFHIKTAGTSYLEALRVIADKSHDLFRSIFAYSLKYFEKDRTSYHLSTDIANIMNIDKIDDERLSDYLDLNDSRQILHVTFGSILTSNMGFKDIIYKVLFENEDLYYSYVKENIEKHIEVLTV